MKALLTNIFTNSGFIEAKSSEGISLFKPVGRKEIEYYLIEFINVKELEEYSSEKAYKLLISDKPQTKDLEKNTSLILCVEFENLSKEYLKYKNAMLRVEENDFWFKKYLLPYTPTALSKFNVEGDVIKTINSIVNNDESFMKFGQDIFNDEFYFLAIQLLIKIPFISLTYSEYLDFISIEQKLLTQLGGDDLHLLYDKITPHHQSNEQWTDLKDMALNPYNTDFDKFLFKFTEDV